MEFKKPVIPAITEAAGVESSGALNIERNKSAVKEALSFQPETQTKANKGIKVW